MKARSPRNRKTRDNIVRFIESFFAANGRHPSVREIGAAVGISSTSTTAGYLSRMVRDGILGKADDRHDHPYFVIPAADRGRSISA